MSVYILYILTYLILLMKQCIITCISYVFSVTTYIPECYNMALCVRGVSVHQCRETGGKHRTTKLYTCVVSRVTQPSSALGLYTEQNYTVPIYQYILYTVYCMATILLNYAISYKIALMQSHK